MASCVLFSRLYAFKLIAGLLGVWLASLGLLCNAAPKANHEYIVASGAEDVLIPEAVKKHLEGSTPFTDPEPDNIDGSLSAALTAAKLPYDDAIFKSSEFSEMKTKFSEQGEAIFNQYGGATKRLLFVYESVLAPCKLAYLAHLCDTDLTKITADAPKLLIPCAVKSNPKAELEVLGIQQGFADLLRDNILQKVAVPAPGDFPGSALSKLKQSDWAKMYKGSGKLKSFWRRLMYSYFMTESKSPTTTVHVFTISADPVDVVQMEDADNYVGYTNILTIKKDEAPDVTLDISAHPQFVKKGTDYMFKSDPIMVHAYSVYLKVAAKGDTPEKSLKTLAELTSQSTSLLFETDAPKEKNYAEVKGHTSSSVRTVTGVLGMWAVFIGMLTSSAALL